jgi:hypothetical protein
LQVILTAWRKTGELDLEAVEMAMRGAMHRAGAAALGQVLSLDHPLAPRVPCRCGGEARWHSSRRKKLQTALGPVEFRRAYYLCPDCHQGQSPRDRQLDVEAAECSPGVRRMSALVGSQSSFEEGREQLALLAGVEVTTKAVERQAEAIGTNVEQHQQQQIRSVKQLELPVVCVPTVPLLYIEMDGTGVPMVKAETADRAGKIEGQPAHTREAKLGCVFTQTSADPQGRPVRDPDSTTYVGAIETAEEFGLRLYTEAWRRGWSQARKKVVLGDGAVWIWNLAGQHFPGAIQIVDLYHARQHLWELSAKLFPQDGAARKRWMARGLKQLDQGKVEALVKTLRAIDSGNEELARLVRNEAEYFARNAQRMRYPAFRLQGLFVGSGVIEAACKTVIAARLKRSGMFWTLRGANAILALRCSRLSRRFDDYWESRSCAA